MKALAPFSSLLDLLLPPRPEALLVRGAPPDSLSARIEPTLIRAEDLSCTGLVPYRDPLMRAAVHEWKYRGNEKAAELLSALLAEYLLGLEDIHEGAVVVPVPLSARRLKERGFNQCEIVAKRALDAVADMRIALDAAVIERTRDTEHQARLSREERARNVVGAFASAGRADPFRTYLLLDDVVTTGATLRAAAAALSAAGARHILCVALAF